MIDPRNPPNGPIKDEPNDNTSASVSVTWPSRPGSLVLMASTVKRHPTPTVDSKAPRNPSHVFLDEMVGMSACRPNEIPQM